MTHAYDTKSSYPNAFNKTECYLHFIGIFSCRDARSVDSAKVKVQTACKSTQYVVPYIDTAERVRHSAHAANSKDCVPARRRSGRFGICQCLLLHQARNGLPAR